MRWTRLTAVACVAAAAGGCGPPPPPRLGDGTCTDVAARLEALPVLAIHPPAATSTDTVSECESGYIPSAAHHYRSALDPKDLLAYYRDALRRDGWQAPDPVPATPGATKELTGYHRRIDGRDVLVDVVYESDGIHYFVAVWAPPKFTL